MKITTVAVSVFKLGSKRKGPWLSIAVFLAVLAIGPSILAQESRTKIRLWETPPGPSENLQSEEADLTKPTDNLIAGKPVIRLGNVSTPTLTFYPAPEDKNTGTTVLVCPGGAYYILALDLEGTEVCEWLNSIGVNACLLKYRVPRREGRAKHDAALEDAQRAMGLIRERAKEWRIHPDRIGVLGFSAGGHLSTMLALTDDKRTYNRLDAADELPCQPNFVVLVYPGYLVGERPGDDLAPEIQVTSSFPPVFMTMAQDDPVDARNVLSLAAVLRREKVPMSIHLYPTGGHGYGLRRTDNPVTHWTDQAEAWMRQQGWLTP